MFMTHVTCRLTANNRDQLQDPMHARKSSTGYLYLISIVTPAGACLIDVLCKFARVRHRARKPAYCGHTTRKQGSWLKKDIMQGTMPGARKRGKPRTAWMDNIKTWTGLPVEESIRMTEDGDKWRKCVHGVADPGIEDG